jgi:DNA-binding transcriptional LysR family regulator
MIDRIVDFETAELFVLVAETGSLAAAARARNISPSLVSRIIAKLEGELHTQLLNRTTRKLVLTESGRTFLAWSREMIASRERILREIDEQQHEPRGLIRVAIEPLVAAFYLPELMRRFSAQYPGITVRIEACDDPPSLLDGRADLAIHAGPLRSEDVYGQQAYEYKRRLIAAPGYIQAHGAPATPQDLLQHRCLTHRSPHSRTWGFRAKDGATVSLEIEPYVETNSWFLLRSLVLRGLGIMRMGAPLAESDIRSGLVVPVLEDYDVLTPESEHLSVWVVHATRQRPRRVQLFAELAVTYLRESVNVKEFDGDLSSEPQG